MVWDEFVTLGVWDSLGWLRFVQVAEGLEVFFRVSRDHWSFLRPNCGLTTVTELGFDVELDGALSDLNLGIESQSSLLTSRLSPHSMVCLAV